MIRRQAIEAECGLPTVLSNIIADYDRIESHSWSIDGPIRAVGGRAGSFLIDRVDRRLIQLDGTSQLLLHNDAGKETDAWFTMVSTTDINNGARRWQVGYPKSMEGGWIGCGVTTSSNHYANLSDKTNRGVSTIDSWIVCDSVRKVNHAGKEAVEAVVLEAAENEADFRPEGWPADWKPIWTTVHAGGRWTEFFADRQTLRIIGRIIDDDIFFVLMTAKSVDQFLSLRPCVVVAGRVSVVLLSDIE